MNTHGRNPKRLNAWTAEHDAVVQRLANAAQLVDQSDTRSTRAQLAKAVDAARAIGVGWAKIGAILGIARGNAYHRYRKRPMRQHDQSDMCDAGEVNGPPS